MSRHTENARERIIDVPEQVVIQNGARHLTFDALVAKSAVSRGGLLYHFPDKETQTLCLKSLTQTSRVQRRPKT